MIIEPKQEAIDKAFVGTSFGILGETPEGRKRLVADCILKRACGFRNGSTIESICKELGFLTVNGTPRKRARRWAYLYSFPRRV